MATNISLRDYEQAEHELAHDEAQRGFRIHATVYALVNVLLFGINMTLIMQTDDDFVWFLFPLVGWGIGLAANYVFGIRGLERNLTERQQRIEHLAAARTTTS